MSNLLTTPQITHIMPTEFEVKFLDINEYEIEQKLISIGATKVHDTIILRRTVFHLCDKNIKGYARVRDDGFGVSMTTKIYPNEKFPEENEVQISNNYDTGVQFMLSLGLEKKANQESYRCKWSHPLAHEITIDTLPALPAWLEIDCTNENNLNELIKLLNLDKSKMRFGAFDLTYNEYYGIELNVINNCTPSLTFKNIQNEIIPIQNKELFENIIHNQSQNIIHNQSQNVIHNQSQE